MPIKCHIQKKRLLCVQQPLKGIGKQKDYRRSGEKFHNLGLWSGVITPNRLYTLKIAYVAGLAVIGRKVLTYTLPISR